jgi:hypothetical protein
MKPKPIITAVLIAFVLASVAFLIANEASKGTGQEPLGPPKPVSEAKQPDAPALPEPTDSNRKVIAYYFHGTARCPTCLKIEAYSRDAIESGFKDALEAGRLEFKSVNVDEPENGHYVQDYDLYTRSLVLVETDGDKQVRWKNLTRVWDLVRSKEQFVKYVQDALRGYLEGT